ncbi:MAG: putative inorganic carbon transporter subunit DabA, partial [Halovenus sp.]
GACAGNPGGPNARVLAAICNDEAVRAQLRDRGIDVPEDTVFVAGEHNTTTDEVELYASDVPETHQPEIDQLRTDLAVAREGATAERAGDMGSDTSASVRETERRAADWAETRPEWGLAGNAGFVIGPRELTDGLDLDGRSFLHSYDWTTDPDGDALEAIMAGPMVVTQWINAQYYFATVDNAVYGSGSKVTHNPVGNVGVYQGNGGDLMTGLPQQSLMSADEEPYHQPLRLSTVIHAPVERVTEILAEHEELVELLDNNWLSVTVVDPTRDHQAMQYTADCEWTPATEQPEKASDPVPTTPVADD